MALAEDEQRRIDAFLYLNRLERGLRTFLERELARADGPTWARALPSDVAAKVTDGTLNFTDFPDLKKVVSSAWRKLPSAESANKAQLLAHLEGLEAIRNAVAHSRDLSAGDVAVAHGAYHKFSRLISPEVEGPHLPATQHPPLAIDRLCLALSHSAALAETDIAALTPLADADLLIDSVRDYDRLRLRPGRSPAALEALADKSIHLLRNAQANIGPP